jgi:hypothetical protein
MFFCKKRNRPNGIALYAPFKTIWDIFFVFYDFATRPTITTQTILAPCRFVKIRLWFDGLAL